MEKATYKKNQFKAQLVQNRPYGVYGLMGSKWTDWDQMDQSGQNWTEVNRCEPNGLKATLLWLKRNIATINATLQF